MKINKAVDKVIALARSEVGYKPYKGKCTKYADDLNKTDTYNGLKDNPETGWGADWCDIFVDWLFITSFGVDTGQKMLYQPKKGCGAGCGYSAGYFRRNNAWSDNPQRGAQIFLGEEGDEEHTGIVIDYDSTYVYTVEGNTGGGNGSVNAKSYRRNANFIAGYGIPNWKLVEPLEDKTLVVDGDFGYESTKALQRWQGTIEDGEIYGQVPELKKYYPALTSCTFEGSGSKCIKALQRYLNGKGYILEEDGIIGKNTITALQKYLIKLGYEVGAIDGIFGEKTAKALQEYLNKVV